jgi:hypothetical protein
MRNKVEQEIEIIEHPQKKKASSVQAGKKNIES